MDNAEKLRQMYSSDETMLRAGIFDAHTAQIAESCGFDALSLGGYSHGASTGTTEPMTDPTEMGYRALEIIRNTNIPLRSSEVRCW